ncbi:hypothetical protein DEO72_LG2g1025 [Vigna unguiculata]|uniref:Uncharacterized protein n=1 Tax=Vigna unguiculata TaxID=3917 RepID=A0A4D6KVQ0_VIGUN|nr:hypothetical protein DEO72_LG2g1025 [Vigna unguiculata]
MSFTACNKHADDDHATRIEESGFHGHGDFVRFVPVISMEGDDDDDDGSYDYAPAA